MAKLIHCTLALCICLACGHAEAAQQAITANRDALLENVEARLEEQQIEVTAQAETNRFAIIYGSRNDGAHVTVTLRQTPLEETLVMLSIATDSPRDEQFDRDLLTAVIEAQH